MNFKIKRTFVASTLSLLSACGGGSGENGVTFNADEPIAITQAKSPEVIVEGNSVANNADGINTGLSLKNNVDSNRGNFDVSRMLINQVKKVQKRTQTALRTESSACSYGGTLSITVNDGASASSATGSMTFDNCWETTDASINGKVGFTLSGSSSAFSATFSYSNFTIQGSDFSFAGSGLVNMSFTDAGQYEEFVFDGSRFVFTVTENGRSLNVGNLVETVRNNFVGGYESFNIRFSANSSVLGGSFTFETTQDLVEYYYDLYPSQGQFVITGAGGSKVRATSQGGSSSSQVLIETDEDGDGTYESSDTMTWQELENAAASALP